MKLDGMAAIAGKVGGRSLLALDKSGMRREVEFWTPRVQSHVKISGCPP